MTRQQIAVLYRRFAADPGNPTREERVRRLHSLNLGLVDEIYLADPGDYSKPVAKPEIDANAEQRWVNEEIRDERERMQEVSRAIKKPKCKACKRPAEVNAVRLCLPCWIGRGKVATFWQDEPIPEDLPQAGGVDSFSWLTGTPAEIQRLNGVRPWLNQSINFGLIRERTARAIAEIGQRLDAERKRREQTADSEIVDVPEFRCPVLPQAEQALVLEEESEQNKPAAIAKLMAELSTLQMQLLVRMIVYRAVTAVRDVAKGTRPVQKGGFTPEDRRRLAEIDPKYAAEERYADVIAAFEQKAFELDADLPVRLCDYERSEWTGKERKPRAKKGPSNDKVRDPRLGMEYAREESDERSGDEMRRLVAPLSIRLTVDMTAERARWLADRMTECATARPRPGSGPLAKWELRKAILDHVRDEVDSWPRSTGEHGVRLWLGTTITDEGEAYHLSNLLKLFARQVERGHSLSSLRMTVFHMMSDFRLTRDEANELAAAGYGTGVGINGRPDGGKPAPVGGYIGKVLNSRRNSHGDPAIVVEAGADAGVDLVNDYLFDGSAEFEYQMAKALASPNPAVAVWSLKSNDEDFPDWKKAVGKQTAHGKQKAERKLVNCAPSLFADPDTVQEYHAELLDEAGFSGSERSSSRSDRSFPLSEGTIAKHVTPEELALIRARAIGEHNRPRMTFAQIRDRFGFGAVAETTVSRQIDELFKIVRRRIAPKLEKVGLRAAPDRCDDWIEKFFDWYGRHWKDHVPVPKDLFAPTPLVCRTCKPRYRIEVPRSSRKRSVKRRARAWTDIASLAKWLGGELIDNDPTPLADVACFAKGRSPTLKEVLKHLKNRKNCKACRPLADVLSYYRRCAPTGTVLTQRSCSKCLPRLSR